MKGDTDDIATYKNAISNGYAKKPNAWITHVKVFAKRNGLSYKDAMMHDKCKTSYASQREGKGIFSSKISRIVAPEPPKRPRQQTQPQIQTIDPLDRKGDYTAQVGILRNGNNSLEAYANAGRTNQQQRQKRGLNV